GWDKAEELLREAMQKRGVEYVEAKDEAAFYGPKIDIQMKNVNGKEDTAFTVQYDLSSPIKFDLTYTGADGKPHRTFVVHRSSIGSIERTLAFLIEKYAGAFPTWLSPVQVKILPISETHVAYAQGISAQLLEAGVRVELDASNESLGKKIRNSKTEKIPYVLVIGDAEIEANSVAVESRDKGKLGAQPFEEFKTNLLLEIKNRS
ncbi:MAG: His/Gly/Thr/Pro-type tRNA ligase C-terminal domain-containing protein, partial [Minisyncoccia bacterium]